MKISEIESFKKGDPFPKQSIYKKRTEVAREDGFTQIYNPLILDVEKGNMISVYETPRIKNNVGWYKTWGTIVLNIDYAKQLILVGDSLGYPAERKEWIPVNDVYTTWNIGGYEKAMELLNAFNQKVSQSQDDLKIDQDLESHIKFKR